MVIEQEPAGLIRIVQMLMEQSRHNEEMRGEKGEKAEMLDALVRKYPNRVYWDGKTKILRSLIFKDREYDYQAFFQVGRVTQTGIIPNRSELLVAREPRAIEDQLSLWARRFGMRKDILGNPETIHLASIEGSEPTYIHTARESDYQIGLEYYLTQFGPWVLNITNHPEELLKDRVLENLPLPAQGVLEYTDPFNSRTAA